MTDQNPEPTAPRALLSVEETAEALGVSRTTVFALIKSGEIETVKVGRLRRVPADSIDAYIAALMERGPEPRPDIAPPFQRPATDATDTVKPRRPRSGAGSTSPEFRSAAAAPPTEPSRTESPEPKPDRPKSKPKRPRKRPEGTRAPNGAGSIYLGKDGKWHGRVTMGIRDDGKPDRRHVERKTEAEVIKAVRELEKQRDNGTKRKPGRVPTFGEWLDHWVENIEARKARFNTLGGHRSNIRVWLKPNLGAHRLDRMEPEHFEKLYTKIEQTRSAYTSLGVHRTARAAFNEAVRRGVVTRNPVALAVPPRVEEEEQEPFDADDVRRIIAAALPRRNGVRFVIALALGNRQGEALGMKWERLNPAKRSIRVRKQLQRQTWQHGCESPTECGKARHKTKPCPPDCPKHKRECPPPCRPDCTDHARHCPKRWGGGLVEVDVKSKAGRREQVLPDRLWEMIEAHREAQDKEREHAGSEWHEGGWMFAQENGKPTDPKADRAEWRAILAEAKVPEARLHNARHTAATVLALLEVAPRAVMDFMGWNNPDMMLRYQHVTDGMRREIAKRLDSHLPWGEKAEKTEPNDSPEERE